MPQDQKIVKDDRGQEQPTDKKRAQRTDQQSKQAALPTVQREGGQHVSEGGDFKPPKQPAGPYDRDKQGKVDSQGLPADDSKFG